MFITELSVVLGMMLPLVGTSLGSACVLFMRKNLNTHIQHILIGFAAGVMTAASIWSLILPSIEQSENMGVFAFVPAFVGFWIGIGFLLLIDKISPQQSITENEIHLTETKNASASKLMLAIVIHNIPEGMAVGVVYASMLSGHSDITSASAFALSLGIAIQNFPEGAIVSMPLRSCGTGRSRSFLYGVLSGVVEPIAAVLTIMLSWLIVPLLPYLLSFAAGAMIYVVVEELVPQMNSDSNSGIAVAMFSLGFTVMMMLDVAFG